MILNEIPEIANALNTAKTKKIRLLHILLFTTEGDRKNRSRIRQFTGFPFSKTDEKFQTKIKEVTDSFTLIDLISIANI